jgi:hypothetical protein
MSWSRVLCFAALVISMASAVTTTPASARTICRPDGFCFNTSGRPIPPWRQPAYEDGYPYHYHPYHRYWRPDYY